MHNKIIISLISTCLLININNFIVLKNKKEIKNQILAEHFTKEVNKIRQDIIDRRIMKIKIEEKINHIAEFKKSDRFRIREEKREQKLKLEKELNIKIKEIVEKEFQLTYYTDLEIENSIYGNITSRGEILVDGMIANNYYDYDTKIYLDGLGMKYIADRGSDKYFNNTYCLDVFIPRKRNENDKDYYKRVNNLGRKKVKGYIIKEYNN